jgi:hypothetical protein
MASFAFQGPRAGLPGHPQHAVGVSVPVGLALFSFLTQTGVLAGTHPPNRALFGDGSAPALGAFQAMMGRATGGLQAWITRTSTRQAPSVRCGEIRTTGGLRRLPVRHGRIRSQLGERADRILRHPCAALPLPVVGGEYPGRDVQGDAPELHTRWGTSHGHCHSTRSGLGRTGMGHVLRGVGDHGSDDR